MTRNGCWRECSSLSAAPVPVVYLSGTRTAPFHPVEKHGGGRNGRFQTLFLRPRRVPPPFRPPRPYPPSNPSHAPISMLGKTPSRELRLITLFCVASGLRAICTYVCVILFWNFIFAEAVMRVRWPRARGPSTLPWTTCRRASSFTCWSSASAADVP